MANRLLEGKKVAVLGLGISGLQSALFLKKQGYEIFVSEIRENEAVKQFAEILRQNHIPFEIGTHSSDLICQSDWILISPGIPPHSEIYRKISEKKIPVYSEIEVAARYCPTDNVIAITGTAGKTTTATLITRLLKKANFSVVSCGNIGNPWIGEIERLKPSDFVVLELSSFQLQHCYQFRPRYAVLLNLSPNHEDWHNGFQDYLLAKSRIFQAQHKEDYALIQKSDWDQNLQNFRFEAKTIFYDQQPVKGMAAGDEHQKLLATLADLLKISQVSVTEVLRDFEGIEHRLEKVAEAGGVTFINDSKCTTTSSLNYALSKYPDQKVILIAGGRPKSKDYENAREWIQKKTKKVFLVGEAAPVLEKAWQGASSLRVERDFKTAVESACECAQKGDTVLLSPACASFDLFDNYQHRGKVFKLLVLERLKISKQPVG